MNRARFITRKTARQIVAKILPGPRWANQQVAVSGLPRSGTSWVAKAISLARGVSYYFEPEHSLGRSYMHTYQPSEQRRSAFYDHLRKTLQGGVTDEYTLAEQGLRELLSRPFASAVLVKWVWLTLALEWIARYFPKLQVVQVIRHPVPQFLSWRQRNWDPGDSLKYLFAQQFLMQGPLQPYQKVMRNASTFWEKAGALWGAVSFMQLRAHRLGWFLVEHEWLCLDAQTRFRWLVKNLGLHWNDEIDGFLSPTREIKSGPGYGERRDPRSEVQKWRSHVTRAELAELREMLAHFELPFYDDLDPQASCASTLHKELEIPEQGLL